MDQRELSSVLARRGWRPTALNAEERRDLGRNGSSRKMSEPGVAEDGTFLRRAASREGGTRLPGVSILPGKFGDYADARPEELSPHALSRARRRMEPGSRPSTRPAWRAACRGSSVSGSSGRRHIQREETWADDKVPMPPYRDTRKIRDEAGGGEKFCHKGEATYRHRDRLLRIPESSDLVRRGARQGVPVCRCCPMSAGWPTARGPTSGWLASPIESNPGAPGTGLCQRAKIRARTITIAPRPLIQGGRPG